MCYEVLHKVHRGLKFCHWSRLTVVHKNIHIVLMDRSIHNDHGTK